MIAYEPVAQPQRIRGPGFWWMVLLSTAAFAAASWASWQRPVWHDELYTLALARMPFAELFEALRMDSGPPLHYLLCHLLYLLVGWQEGSNLGALMVRLPSVLAFTLLPWVVWRARPRTTGAGLLGPLLTVTWLPMFYFATEARAYALLALVNALVWIRGPKWIERGRGGAVRFAVAAACLPLLHYTGWASFIALPVLALFLPRSRRSVLATALVCAALPGLLWLPIMLGAPHAAMSWLAATSGPGCPGLATLAVVAPAGPFPALFEAPPMPLPGSASSSVFALLLAGAVMGGRRLVHDQPGGTDEGRSAVRLGLGLVPAVGLGAAALAGVPLYFAGRTESMVWALVVSLVAILIFGLPPMARLVAAGPYVTVGLLSVGAWMADLPRRPVPPGVEVGRELAGRIEANDRVVVAGLWQLEVRHGLAEGARDRGAETPPSLEVGTVPASQAAHPGWFDRDAAASPTVLGEALALRDGVERRGGKIWLVRSPALPLEETFFPAFAGWLRVELAQSPIIAVDLLVPPANGAAPAVASWEHE